MRPTCAEAALRIFLPWRRPARRCVPESGQTPVEWCAAAGGAPARRCSARQGDRVRSRVYNGDPVRVESQPTGRQLPVLLQFCVKEIFLGSLVGDRNVCVAVGIVVCSGCIPKPLSPLQLRMNALRTFRPCMSCDEECRSILYVPADQLLTRVPTSIHLLTNLPTCMLMLSQHPNSALGLQGHLHGVKSIRPFAHQSWSQTQHLTLEAASIVLGLLMC